MTTMMINVKHYWRRAALVLAAVGLAVGSMTGCGASDGDCQGDKGKVSAKEQDTETTGTGKNKTTTYEYELTILREDGTTYEKDVSSTAYDWYKRGSTFPHPSKCEDGKVK